MRRRISVTFIVVIVTCVFIGVVAEREWRIGATVVDLQSKGCFVVGRLKSVSVPHWLSKADLMMIIESLRALGAPERLVLSGHRIDEEVANQVAMLNWLRFLDISGADVTDDAFRRMTKLPRLEYLVADETAISDASVPAILELKHLQVVSVVNTGISTEGVKALARSIQVVRVE